MENEIWKDVIGFEGFYMVSDMGRVKSLGRIVKRSTGDYLPVKERIMKQTAYPSGYLSVTMYKGQDRGVKRAVHRLVAEAFIDNPHSLPEVNHINGIKNDNRLMNLEWVTTRENQYHSIYVTKTHVGGGQVEQLHKHTKEVLSVHENAMQAALSLNKTPKQVVLIRRCMAGDRKTAYGFSWRYKK